MHTRKDSQRNQLRRPKYHAQFMMAQKRHIKRYFKPSLARAIKSSPQHQQLGSLAIQMMLDCYFSSKGSSDIIRDFLVGLNHIRTEWVTYE